MTDKDVVVTEENEVMWPNDQVPDQWKGLFSNDEWYMHDIVVKSTYGFLAIAVVAHLLVYLWQPWLP